MATRSQGQDSDEKMRQHLSYFKSALAQFSSSTPPVPFRILASLPHAPNPHDPPPRTLYILDSSFNPPTLAHRHIALTALREDKGSAPKRLLLLLATQNADKAPKPAAFEQRLVMMRLLAQDIRQELEKEAGATEEQQPPDDASSQDHNAKRGTGGHESHSPAIPAIDIAVTIHPMFIHKSLAIAQSGSYSASPPPSSEDSSSPPTPSCEQVHIIGYDTLIRLLDTRYYPPEHTLAPLIPFMAAHRLRVTYRRPDPSSEAERKWGSREVQHGYLNDLAEGKREDEGGQREWAERVEFAEGMTDGQRGGVGVVSSTRARKAAKAGDEGLLRGLVCGGVADWIVKEKLYTNDE